MLTVGGLEARERTPNIFRLVLGGFDRADRLWRAYSELCTHGVADAQLCVFCLSDATRHVAPDRSMPFLRSIDGIRLRVSSGALFDKVRLADAEPFGAGAFWMSARQAEALWQHIRRGWPALLAEAFSPDEQVACSRLQLRHRPRFLHTFVFTGQ